MQDLSLIQLIAIWALPVLLAITLHEVAHGRVALYFGDTTAKMLGRLSLNPLRHIDLIGTVLVPLVLLALGGFMFGWAKPVPVNIRNLRHPRRDMAFVAVAGPLSNIAMAFAWGLLIKFGLYLDTLSVWAAAPIVYMGFAGVMINIVLAVLNLIPLPPLDGGRVLAGLLPPKIAIMLDRVEPYGIFILIGLLAAGLLGDILTPPVMFLRKIIVLTLNI